MLSEIKHFVLLSSAAPCVLMKEKKRSVILNRQQVISWEEPVSVQEYLQVYWETGLRCTSACKLTPPPAWATHTCFTESDGFVAAESQPPESGV